MEVQIGKRIGRILGKDVRTLWNKDCGNEIDITIRDTMRNEAFNF